MSQSNNFSKLFQRFSDKNESYKEIVGEDAVTESRECWPLLSALRVDRSDAVQPAPQSPESSLVVRKSGGRVPLWRNVQSVISPVGLLQAKPPPSAEGPAPGVFVPAASATPSVSAMAPRLRTPEGMPPARHFATTAGVFGAPAKPVVAAASVPISAPVPSPMAPPMSRYTEPVRPAGTELSQVFTRLKSQAESATKNEHAPVRRSFLDRLNRS